MRRRDLGALATIVALVSTASAAGAETAKDAYEEGTRAHKAGDLARAAAAFARADALSPNDTALKAALDDAARADDPVLGADLLERSRTRTLGAAAQASVTAATAKLAHRSGVVHVDCVARCTITIDGKDASPGADVRTTLGSHTVVAHFDGATETHADVVVNADQTSTLKLAAPEPPPPPPTTAPTPTFFSSPPPPDFQPAPTDDRRGGGIHPALFFVGLGLTVAAGATTLGLGLYTMSLHGDFGDQGCAVAANPGCKTLSRNGQDAQLATDVLGGVTGALGLTTVIVAIFTRWHKPAPVFVTPNGLGLSVSGSF